MVGPARAAEIIAHRGASAYAPEHTFAAYDLALELGADALELDVRGTADGELLVVHDPLPARLDLEMSPLTLDAVLGRYAASTSFVIELKDPAPAWEHGVLDAIERHRLCDRSTVISFDAGSLRRLRGAARWLDVAPLFDREPPRAAGLAAVALFATGIGPRHDAVDPALVADAHAHGLSVRAWTANAIPDIERLITAGVDGVITDVPDVARAIAGGGRELAVA